MRPRAALADPPRAGARAAAERTQPPIRAFASSLPMALLRARESVMRRFRPGLRRHGVTEQQWRVLRALAGHRGLELAELAARTCLLPPSLSRILPDLESRGLLARAAVAADMRRSSASLTAEGAKLIAAHAPESEAIYRAIEGRFGPERLAHLLELLGELEEAAAPAPSAAASRRARPRAAAGRAVNGTRRAPAQGRR